MLRTAVRTLTLSVESAHRPPSHHRISRPFWIESTDYDNDISQLVTTARVGFLGIETWKMSHLSGNSRVTPISNKPFLLDDFLRPIWKFLRYTGFQHGFLGPMEEWRVFYILRCVSTTLIILSVCNLDIFYLVGLLRRIPNKKTIDEVILNAHGLIIFFIPIVFSLQLYRRHEKLIEFFQEWKRVEASFDHCSNRRRTEFLANLLRSCLIASVILSPIIYFWSVTEPNVPVFFASVEVLREIFGLHFLSFYFVACNFFSGMTLLLSDMIPAFIFYQAGCMIENLKLELDDCLANFTNSILPANENPYRFIWKKYESIEKLVDRANQLFGVIMLVSQFCYICLACLSIYSLTEESTYIFFLLNCFILIMNAILRTLGCNWLYSHLPLSCGELKKSVSVLLSEKWYLMSQDHQNYLSCFFNRLDGGELVARPLNLFSIDPSNVLSLLTFQISYTIVLLQLTWCCLTRNCQINAKCYYRAKTPVEVSYCSAGISIYLSNKLI